jgi:hypothetical protein
VPLDRAGLKRLIFDLDLWCSSCMVAFDGRDPVAVLLGAKRPESTLVHTLRVHPEHRRRGHGRHLLTSLTQKLAILGPPRLVAEVPAEREAACAAYAACGWTLESRLTDWERKARPRPAAGGADLRQAIGAVSYDDLVAADLLGAGPKSWLRERPALAKLRDLLSGLAFHSPDRIEAWLLWMEGGAGEPWPILTLGAAPSTLGRIGLAALIDELAGLAGDSPLRVAHSSPDELTSDHFIELGFEAGVEHLLFSRAAQAA